jgi:hypothetical protein
MGSVHRARTLKITVDGLPQIQCARIPRVSTFGFLKFGRAEHMAAFLRDGAMYCNTVRYFQDLEDDELRGDSCEGLRAAWDPQTKFINFHGIDLDPADFVRGSKIKISRTADLKRNLFCLYALKPESAYIDPKNFAFGEWCIYIHSPSEFIHRVALALRHYRPRGARVMKMGPVTYLDGNGYDGKMDPFKKFDPFTYQSEYRFVFHPGAGRPLRFRIGSIQDIAEPIETERVNRFFGLMEHYSEAG